MKPLQHLRRWFRFQSQSNFERVQFDWRKKRNEEIARCKARFDKDPS